MAGGDPTQTSLTLTAAGITLMGVLLSIGVTVGLGVDGPWWAQVLAGGATTVALAAGVKVGSSTGRGPLARVALWMIGPDEGGERR